MEAKIKLEERGIGAYSQKKWEKLVPGDCRVINIQELVVTEGIKSASCQTHTTHRKSDSITFMSEWGITTPTGKTSGKQKENIDVWKLDGDSRIRGNSEKIFFFFKQRN